MYSQTYGFNLLVASHVYMSFNPSSIWSLMMLGITRKTYCYGLASVVVRRALTSSPQKLLGQSLPNLVCSIIRGSRPEIVNFMTPPP